MLKSYEAIYENGEVKWLKDKPQKISARIIVTILEETPSHIKRRIPPASIAGKGKTIGDITAVPAVMSPIVYFSPRRRTSLGVATGFNL